MADPKKYPRCRDCGCLDIVADGSVGWNQESMEWELSGNIEGEFCPECSSEEIEWIDEPTTIICGNPRTRANTGDHHE